MRISAPYKYQLYDHKSSIIIYYIIILLLILLMFLSVVSLSFAYHGEIVEVKSDVSFGGFEAATCIFLFISGMCCFKENFRFLSLNGVSRLSFFWSRVLVFLSVSAIMVIIDTAVRYLVSFFGSIFFHGSISQQSIYGLIFYRHSAAVGPVATFFENMLFCFLVNIFLLSLGYIITLIFYRLNKPGKTCVGVGVPVLLLIVLPILDSEVFHDKISDSVSSVLNYILGVGTGLPWRSMITFLVSFAVLMGICFLLILKAPVKDN